MTALTGKKPKDTYKDLLQVSNANRGIDGVPRPVEDGEGTESALLLATDRVSLAGNELVLDGDGDTSIAAAEDDRIDVKLAGAVDFRFREDALEVLSGSTLRLERGASLAIEDGATVTGLSAPSAPSPVPAGMLAPFAGAAAPAGWLLCYGQAVSRTDYAALFAALGTTYGAGDGSTTFNLPDLRGRAVAGKDDMGGTAARRLTGSVDGDRLGAAGGAQTHKLTSSQMPSHSHGDGTLATSSAGSHRHSIGTGSFHTSSNHSRLSWGNTNALGSLNTGSAGSHSHTISGSTGSAGSSRSHNNVQPTMVLNWIVKT